MYSLAKALFFCGLYVSSNSQYNVYQVVGQPQPQQTQNQPAPKPQTENNNPPIQTHSYPTNQPSQPRILPLPPVKSGPRCVPNNNFNKINCSTKGKSQCVKKAYGSSDPFTTCGVSHLGVKYDFHEQCQVCNSAQIDFYFQCSCEHTPVICNSNQQCLDGICVKIISQQPPMNCDCHTDADCTQNSYICQNYKCVAKKWNRPTSKPKSTASVSKSKSVNNSKPKSPKKQDGEVVSPDTKDKKNASKPKKSSSVVSNASNASTKSKANSISKPTSSIDSKKDRSRSTSGQKRPLKQSLSKKQPNSSKGDANRDECSSSVADTDQDGKSRLTQRLNSKNQENSSVDSKATGSSNSGLNC